MLYFSLRWTLKSRQKTQYLALIILCLFAQPAQATFYQQLVSLDKIKTQNFNEFSAELNALSAQQSLMSANEREYWQFLQIYRQIYLSGYAAVTSDIVSMLNATTSDEIRFRLAALAINAYFISKDYRLAFTYADQVLRSVSEIHDQHTLRQVLAPVAMLFIDIGQEDIANYYIGELRKTSVQHDNNCIADYLQFTLTRKLSPLQQINADADRAIASCDQVGEILWRDLVYVQWTKTLLDNAQIAQAQQLINRFKTDAIRSSYPVLVIGTYAVIAELAFVQQDYLSASTNVEQALLKAQNTSPNDALIWANETAYKIAAAQGRYQDALSLHQKYIELARKVDSERADKQFAYELVKSELDIKNKSIELLNKDNQLLQLQHSIYQHQEQQSRMLIAALIVVLTVALISAYRGISGRRRFKRIAEFDQLTGISNRYHLYNQAAVALDYCEKNSKPLAAILFDLDNFKQINDRYGHAIGDWALRAVVNTCRNFMRNNDVFGRIGGEEFVIILPGCQSDKAVLLAEICRDAIASIDTAASGTVFPLTASFGVSGSETSGYQLKQLLSNADKAMYQAKQSGRNQVASFTAES